MALPDVVQAGAWGLLAGGALLIGAVVAWRVRVPSVVVAAVMAFGAGVLVSAVAFELVEEADLTGGLAPTIAGFAGGAVVYTAANAALERHGAAHRKRSGSHPTQRQPTAAEDGGSGTAIAVGALLDGVPESAVIGVSLLGSGGVGVATVAAIFLSNLPEGLSSVAGMRAAGRSAGYVFGVWGAIAVISGLSAVAGYAGGEALGDTGVAGLTAFAAGAILAMVADTMIPEAVHGTGGRTGLLVGAGFLTAYAIGQLG